MRAAFVLTSAIAVSLGATAGFVALVVVPAQSASAETVDEQIAALKALEKSDEAKCVAKMQELKDAGDPKVWDAIKKMAKDSKSEKVQTAAIRMVAHKKPPDLEFQKWLVGKATNKDLADPKDGKPELYKVCVEALLPYGDANKSALGAIEKFVDKFLSTKPEYSTRLIRVFGTVREKSAAEQLLKWAEETEANAGGKSGGGGGGGGGKGGVSQETRDNYGKARTAIIETLNEMTGQDISDVESWKKWWGENGKTYKFPEPGAPAVAARENAIDPQIAEFKDESYGFSMKKPAGENWFWGKADYTADETPRVMLTYAPIDDPKNMSARAYFIIHPCKKPPPDVKGMIEWALNSKDGPYKTQLEYDAEHAPKVETKTVGGAEWTVISCKGNGLAGRKGFGSQERRFYFVKFDTNILYVDAVCTLGSEEEVKKAFWACLDSISVPTAKKK